MQLAPGHAGMFAELTCYAEVKMPEKHSRGCHPPAPYFFCAAAFPAHPTKLTIQVLNIAALGLEIMR